MNARISIESSKSSSDTQTMQSLKTQMSPLSDITNGIYSLTLTKFIII